MDKNKTLILCVQRGALDMVCTSLDPSFTPDNDAATLHDMLIHAHWTFRGIAEKDELQKQVIPYMVVNSMGKVLAYWRSVAGGEQRLHGKRSIGFGGHIEVTDSGFGGAARNPIAAFYNGAARELKEELIVKSTPHVSLSGYVNSNDDAVGRVHLGVVISVRTSGAEPSGDEHAKWAWISREEAEAEIEDFEEWSKLLIRSDAFWATIPQPQRNDRLVQFRSPGGAVMYSPDRDVAYLGLKLLREMQKAASVFHLSYVNQGDAYNRALTGSGLSASEFDAECIKWVQAIDGFLTKVVESASDASLFKMLHTAAVEVRSPEVIRYMLAASGQAFLALVLGGIRSITKMGEEVDFNELLTKVYPQVNSALDGIPPHESAVSSLRGAIQNARCHGVSFEDIESIVRDCRLGRH